MNRKTANLRKQNLFKMTSIFLAISFMGTFLCKENAHASEKPYIITTIAGTGTSDYSGDGDKAIKADLQYPSGVAVDSTGNIYIADTYNNRIRKIDKSSGNITTIAGTGDPDYSGDGSQAVYAKLKYPAGIAVDDAGNVYISDTNNHCIREINTSGIITTIAGIGGSWGFSGDNDIATNAQLHCPVGIALDSAGNIYIADSGNNRIRKIDKKTSIITTIAGTNNADLAGDGDLAINANLSNPYGVTVDSSGNVYIADTMHNRIRKIDEKSGIINSVATCNGFVNPYGIAADKSGNVYFSGNADNTINKIDSNNNVSVIAGTGDADYSGDGGMAINAKLNQPTGVTVDSSGNVYIADSHNNRIRELSEASSACNIEGAASPMGAIIDNSSNSISSYVDNERTSLTVDVTPSAGATWKLYSDSGCTSEITSKIMNNLAVGNNIAYIKVTAQDGITAKVYKLTVRRQSASYIINTIAGIGGNNGFTGDGGLAINAELNYPYGVAVDSSGNVYIADANNHRIREIDTNGNIKTIAGTGTQGFAGDRGLATNAELNDPHGVAVDSAGNVYIADMKNNRIRKIDKSNGNISTIAGTGTEGFAGDGGLAINAALDYPSGVAVDSSGNVYIADMSNNRIRKIDKSSGKITTIAGTGNFGYTGDGGLATSAELNNPYGVAVDSTGNVYIADTNNDCVRKLTEASSACDATSVTTPNGATINGSNITAAVDNSTTSLAVDVTPSADATWKLYSDSGCTQLLAGNIMSSLKVGDNTAYIKVTAQDGTTSKIYTLTVTRAVSSACDITSVTTPNRAAINGSNITAAVDNSTTSLTVAVTPSADATWMLYSDSSCTQALAGNIMTGLAVGNNIAYIKVTAQDGTTSKIYTLTVTRAASSACDVTSVTIPKGAAINGSNITAAVDNSTTSLAVAVTPSADATWMLYSDSSCTQILAGNIMSSLQVGDNTAYIKVTAQDGSTNKIYKLKVTRAASSACDVMNVTTPSGAVINGTNIIAAVDNSITSLAVDVTPSADATWKLYSDSGCTQTLAGNIMSSLQVGDNTAYIKVTAQDGTTSKVYALTVTRAASSACNIISVTIPKGAVINGNNISAAVGNATTSLTVAVTPSADATWKLYSDSNCTKELTGNVMSNLAVGSNIAYIKVIAQDGTISKVYTLTVTRAASSACDITSITTPNGAVINGSNITVTLDNSSISFTVNVMLSDNASWKLYSDSSCTKEITNKTISSLAVGDNKAYIKVTAQDGTASKVYTLIIKRAAPSTGGKVATNNLVQTGSILNFEDIVISGLLFMVTGAILIKKKKRKATE